MSSTSLRRFAAYVLVTVMACVPAVVLRVSGWRPDPILDAFLFGVAILAAGFLLSWAAEAAEQRVSQGLILAAVALITVLPEYAVDIYYAYQAGRLGPESQYVHYAAANMTGANRLLVGIAWPLIVLLHWAKDRHRALTLPPSSRVEIAFLLLASIYAFTIVIRQRITLIDFVVLTGIFGLYLWRVRGNERAPTGEEEEPGPAAALARLPRKRQWQVTLTLGAVACGAILLAAEPFAESMIGSGRRLGIDEFLLIQWLAPLASEAPAVTIAVLFVMSGRAADGLLAMVSDKINQWTLLVGMLPLALSFGAGAVGALPLDGRQGEEFFLTAAQSMFGIALLLTGRVGFTAAASLAALFLLQVALALMFRDDPAMTIRSLTALGWFYLALAAGLFVIRRRALAQVVQLIAGRDSAGGAGR